jgi:hypothetical protein
VTRWEAMKAILTSTQGVGAAIVIAAYAVSAVAAIYFAVGRAFGDSWLVSPTSFWDEVSGELVRANLWQGQHYDRRISA